MKKVISAILVPAVIMAAIPAAANIHLFSQSDFPHTPKKTEAEKISASFSSFELPENITYLDLSSGKTVTRSSQSTVRSLTGAVSSEDFLEDEIKALAAAFQTQMLFECNSDKLAINTHDPEVFLDENALKNKFGKNYTTFRAYCGSVSGIIITENGKPMNLNITALTDSPTKNSALLPKAVPFNALSPNHTTEISFTKEDFFKRLKEFSPQTDISADPKTCVGETKYLSTGETESVFICGTKFTADELCEIFGLEHKRFTLLYFLDEFRFTVTGDAVSSCLTPQAARSMALQGNTFPEILGYFYYCS